nr:diguanylate cyclase [uncultured Desulfuromonas sp.]
MDRFNLTLSSRSTETSPLRIFLGICLVMVLVLCVIFYQGYSRRVMEHQQEMMTQQEHVMALITQELRLELSTMLADLSFLSQQNEVIDYATTQYPEKLHGIAREFAAFARARGWYIQIRFLDASGQEKVRVNYDGEKQLHIVESDHLQNKSDHEYFQKGIALQQGQTFLSPFDLNIENNQFQVPYQPTLRFVAPVFSPADTTHPRGVIVLNYNGQLLLSQLVKAEQLTESRLLFLNRDGYWMRGLSENEEWGNVIKERANFSFYRQFPEEWNVINQQQQGQLLSRQGLFTFQTIKPQDATLSTNESRWILVSYTPDRHMFVFRIGQLNGLLKMAVPLFVLGIVPAWIIALFLAHARERKLDLAFKANYDRLTGLPNRTLFADRFDQVLWASERNKTQFAVLYCDLDGFKAVNDGLGHDAGDELLVAIARTMEAVVRKSDTIARLGGDEFVVLLANIKSAHDAEQVAEKIIASLTTSFTLKKGQARVGVSIGISCYPADSQERDELLRFADQAMYRAKNKGKGCYFRHGQQNDAEK